MDGAGQKASTRQPRERRLVRRSRLLSILEGADQRTVLLVAPAGYGKTTLARQWLETVSGGLVRVTTASTDIPVLARAVASALEGLCGLDARRVETALGAGKSARDQVTAVCKTVLAQVEQPLESWLVIDDYHLLTSNPAAEELVGTLEASGRFKLMVASRERPIWATSRRRLYFETLEFGASDLALDEKEIAQLLAPNRGTVGLRSQARGWPAVIALAAHAGARDVPLSADAISATLYDYLAEELFERAPLAVREGLMAMTALPSLSAEELNSCLGQPGIADQLVATGLAYEAEERIEVHPLARQFLQAKLRTQSTCRDVALAGFRYSIQRGLYDHGFMLIKEFALNEKLEQLIESAYGHLIETGRLATLDSFARYAAAHSEVPQRLLDLIMAEVALIEGDFSSAETHGKSSAKAFPDDHALKARAYLIAGRAVHLSNEFDHAFKLFSIAGQYARSARDIRDAVWGKCLAAVFLEDDCADALLREFELMQQQNATDRLRIATARAALARLAGRDCLQTSEADVSPLLTAVTDPWVRSGWSYTRGYLLTLQARYKEARSILRETLSELSEYGLSFGVPHVDWTLAACELGLRHFSSCDALLRKVERNPSYPRDLHLQLNTRVLRARLQLAQQEVAGALETMGDDFGEAPSRAMYGEYIAMRALALVVAGESKAAFRDVALATETTRAVDTQILCAAVRAIASFRDEVAWERECGAFLDLASVTGAWDGVVAAVRASPPLLERLATISNHKAELRNTLIRSNDVSLAKGVGLVTRSTGPRGVLSPREREIMEHVRQGRRNTEIAASLFIAPGTVKSHLDHIFDKLGVRSRTAAVARYAEIEYAAAEDSSGS